MMNDECGNMEDGRLTVCILFPFTFPLSAFIINNETIPENS
jgi:hypothetical protein